MDCPLCDRELVPGRSVNEHHLIPRLKKGTQADPCHVLCHNAIHANYTERELETEFHTWALLRKAPKLQAFIRWVKSKPPEFMARTKEAHSKSRKRR